MAHDTKSRYATRDGSTATHQEKASGEGACPREVNVGDVERVLSAAGGGLLAMLGAARGGLSGLGLAALGGGLLYRGATGHCQAYKALGIDTTDHAEPSRGSDLGRAHS